jgi:hypothetical protein
MYRKMCVGFMQTLCYFTKQTWMSKDFSIWGGSRTQPPQIQRNDCMWTEWQATSGGGGRSQWCRECHVADTGPLVATSASAIHVSILVNRWAHVPHLGIAMCPRQAVFSMCCPGKSQPTCRWEVSRSGSASWRWQHFGQDLGKCMDGGKREMFSPLCGRNPDIWTSKMI